MATATRYGYGPEYESTPIYEGWTVDHGFSTSMWHDRRGRLTHVGTRIVNDRAIPDREVGDEVFWRVEIVRTKAEAQRIWRNREAINAGLRAAGVQHGRLSIKFDGDTISVRDYDRYDSFAFQVEAVR